MTENDLAAQAAAGDPDAERRLYETYGDRIYRLAYRMTGDQMLAEDLTQDTFVRAFAKLGTFRGASSFGTWLYAIASSVILNGLRRVRRFKQREVMLDDSASAHARDEGPDLAVQARLNAAVDELPRELRLVLIMYDVEGFSHEEIALALGISSGASRMRLLRARGRLREALADLGGVWSE